MSNFDRAVKALNAQGAYCGQCSREPGDSLDDCRDCAAVLETYANALEEAGLLAPDLPEPYPYSGASPCWYEGSFRAGISSTFGGHEPKVTFTNLEPGGVVHMDSESARELAHALLAAAEHAEKEQGNE